MQNEPFFAGPGLDRADHLRSNEAAIDALRQREDALALVWDEHSPALHENGGLTWARAMGNEPLFLGLDGDSPRFSALPNGSATASAFALFGLLAQLNLNDAPIFAAALSLANWHRRHLFCSVCGAATEPNRGGWSRRCGECDAEHYPRSDPVVIMLAEHDGRLLLGRQPQYPPGRYSALAGFVEPGETIEAAVAREIKEEACIAVTNVRYLASQPWPFPSSLMIGAWAEAQDDALVIDTNELEDARWFSRDEIELALAGDPSAPFQAPPRMAIARTILERWLDGLK